MEIEGNLYSFSHLREYGNCKRWNIRNLVVEMKNSSQFQKIFEISIILWNLPIDQDEKILITRFIIPSLINKLQSSISMVKSNTFTIPYNEKIHSSYSFEIMHNDVLKFVETINSFEVNSRDFKIVEINEYIPRSPYLTFHLLKKGNEFILREARNDKNFECLKIVIRDNKINFNIRVIKSNISHYLIANISNLINTQIREIVKYYQPDYFIEINSCDQLVEIIYKNININILEYINEYVKYFRKEFLI